MEPRGVTRGHTTVEYDSGIDKGNHADQKYGYQDNPEDSSEVDHSAVRTLYGENKYDLRYWPPRVIIRPPTRRTAGHR